MLPKAQVRKEKPDELDFIKIKTLCFKGHCQKNEETPCRWEKGSARHVSDKVWCPDPTEK